MPGRTDRSFPFSRASAADDRSALCRWVEQDADELLASVRHCIDSVCREMAAMGLDAAASVACVGIANQRETVVAWDSITGRPIYNAIGMRWGSAICSSALSLLISTTCPAAQSGAIRGRQRCWAS